MKLGQRQRRLQDLQMLRAVFGDSSQVTAAGTILASIRKQERELANMMNPEVLQYRNQSPKSEPAESTRNVRPPPKSFAEFESNRNKDPQHKTIHVPEPAPTQAAAGEQAEAEHETLNLRQRLGFLEDRADKLEDAFDELTDLVTKPKQEALPLIRRLVKLTVVDRLMPAEACLRAIAEELGVVVESAPRPVPSAAETAPRPHTLVDVPQITHYEPVPETAPKRTGRPKGSGKPGIDAERKHAQSVLQKHELSQSAFAERIGIQQGTLSRWLLGNNITNSNVAAIRRGLAKLEK